MTIALLHLRPDQQAEALEARRTFTTVLAADRHRWGERRPTLLIVGGTIIELGHVTAESNPVATGWRRMRYRTFRSLEDEIEVDDILAALDQPFTRLFQERSSGDLVLPDRTGAAVFDALVGLSEEVREVRSDFLGRPRRARRRLRGQALQGAAQEADAVRLAVDIAGIGREQLGGVRPDGDTPYLQALQEVRVYEDQAITYDAGRFLDFDRLEQPNGVVHFAKGKERLTVLNVNRRPLEQTTGADLIYHNESQGSFVLVQYKTMSREGEAGESELVFRPSSDANLAGELERMRQIAEAPGDGSAGQWRLHPGFCFIKLCSPVANLDYPERQLVGGMYLPLDYWDLLADSEETRGPRGGTVFSYDTVRRRFDNTLFVSLVRAGWIGSRAQSSETITDLVLQGLAADRSVTIAAAWRRPSPAGRGRGRGLAPASEGGLTSCRRLSAASRPAQATTELPRGRGLRRSCRGERL